MKEYKGKITENFYWSEFFKSNIAKRKNITNIPQKEWIYENIEKLCVNILQPLRDKFGPIYITSGFRSVELNNEIGGSKWSNHLYGYAADIESREYPLITLLEWIHDKCDYRELIAEYFPNGWIHVAYKNNHNTRELKLKDLNHNYTPCSLHYIKQLYSVSI